MKKVSLIVILVYGFTAANAQNRYSNAIKEQITKVENSIAGGNILERMKYYNVKGLSVAVVKNYKLIWAKGYGWADEKTKQPVTTTTLFEPGSISKSLNAVGVLKLAQDGKLNLNKDINELLTSWQFPYDNLSKGKKITLSHLLSHTAGTSVYGFPGYNRKSKTPTVLEVLDGKAPANTPPVRSVVEPGLGFQYSGGGTTIAQLIITDVSQKPYDQFMYDNVLKPMGMTQSFYTQPPAKNKMKNMATGYFKDGVEVENKFYTYPEQAAAGLWTTPTDLSKYIIETQMAYLGNPSKVLNQEMTKLHLTPYIDKSSALGTFVQERNGVKYFFHDAGNKGFRGLYFASVEGGDGIVVFVNSDDGDIIIELLNSVASIYDWKGF